MQWRSSVCRFFIRFLSTAARWCGNCSNNQFLACRKYCMTDCRAKICPIQPYLNAIYMLNLSIKAYKTSGSLSRYMHCCRLSQLTSSSSRNFKNECAAFFRAPFVLVGARLAWLIFLSEMSELECYMWSIRATHLSSEISKIGYYMWNMWLC